MKHKALKQNIIFAAVVLAAAALLFGLRLYNERQHEGETLQAVLTYGEENQTMILPLDKDAVYDVDTGLYTVHLEVKDGAAGFVNSPCPDHVCEGYGYLSTVDAQAICMPAKAWLVIEPAA